jgi:formylglycine-generating enzyme required for sulfatase activity
VILGIGGGVLVLLLGVVLTRAIRRRQRPQYSLVWFLAMTVAAGIGLQGGLHCFYSARALSEAQREYEAALARFKSSYDEEKPAHDVTISTPYYIGKYEVTQEQYQQVMGSNPSHFRGRDLPVERVSWDDAKEFCKRVTEKAGPSVRLPSGAEWERACRAGTRTTYYTGDSDADLDRVAWYGNNSKDTTHPVGQKTSNAWGVHDMHGNVCEWCVDWYETYKAEAVVDPHGLTEGRYRVLRGGSWHGLPGGCRSADRFGCSPGSRDYVLGFRVVGLVPRTPVL